MISKLQQKIKDKESSSSSDSDDCFNIEKYHNRLQQTNKAPQSKDFIIDQTLAP